MNSCKPMNNRTQSAAQNVLPGFIIDQSAPRQVTRRRVKKPGKLLTALIYTLITFAAFLFLGLVGCVESGNTGVMLMLLPFIAVGAAVVWAKFSF